MKCLPCGLIKKNEARHTERNAYIYIYIHITIIMYSCYFSRLEHISHYKAKNQNTVKANTHKVHIVNRIA